MERNTCNDFYGEPLSIGDRILSVQPESKLSNTIGIIKEISYLDTTEQSFITIIDEQGNILLKNVNSTYYSTEERIKKYRNDYIHYLCFMNKEGKVIYNKPLTNQMNLDFQIPENTLWIEYKINKLTNMGTYERYSIFSLIIDDHLSTNFEKKGDKYFIQTSKFIYCPGFSDRNLITFKNREELQLFVTSLINFFHENLLGQYNNQKLFDENHEAHKLSRKLTKFIEGNLKTKKF